MITTKDDILALTHLELMKADIKQTNALNIISKKESNAKRHLKEMDDFPELFTISEKRFALYTVTALTKMAKGFQRGCQFITKTQLNKGKDLSGDFRGKEMLFLDSINVCWLTGIDLVINTMLERYINEKLDYNE